MHSTLHSWLQGIFGAGVPEWVIPNQAMLVALGFSLAAVAAVWLGRRAGLPLRRLVLGLSACFVGAIIGAKVVGGLMQPDVWLKDPLAIIDFGRTGVTSFGALLGGCVGFWLYLRKAGADVWQYADAVVPAAGLGLFFARLGCFVHGCDFGRMTDFPWGVRYPAWTMPWSAQANEGFVGEHQLESLPVVPFPLFLAFLNLLIFALFAWRTDLGREYGTGRRAVLAASLYFAGRFLLEFFRSPWSSDIIGFLNMAQWLALFSLVVMFALKRWLDEHRPQASASVG